MKYLARALAILIGLSSIPGALAFGAYVSAVILMVLVAALWSRQWSIAALFFVLSPIALVLEYQSRIETLSQRYEQGGAEALSTRDRVTIYALNLEMAIVGAAVGFPEAAYETTLMALHQRAPVDGDGAFLLECPKIRRVIRAGVADPRTTLTLPSPRWRYDPRTESLRVGLAVNGAPRIVLRWDDAGVVHVSLTVRITYPPEYKLVLMPSLFGRPLYIDEGLFHALEEVGWLTSYDMRWHTSVAEDVEWIASEE